MVTEVQCLVSFNMAMGLLWVHYKFSNSFFCGQNLSGADSISLLASKSIQDHELLQETTVEIIVQDCLPILSRLCCIGWKCLFFVSREWAHGFAECIAFILNPHDVYTSPKITLVMSSHMPRFNLSYGMCIRTVFICNPWFTGARACATDVKRSLCRMKLLVH